MKAVFFDFDGVICHDLFYTTLKKDYADVYTFIQEEVFSTSLVDKWMRNEKTSSDINKLIAQETRIDFNTLDFLFRESVKQMKFDQKVINFISSLSCKKALVTDNMDIFNEITKKRLEYLFPTIIVSCDYGTLKKEGLFDIALEEMGLSSYNDTLLFDDSKEVISAFKGKGILFKDYKELCIT